MGNGTHRPTRRASSARSEAASPRTEATALGGARHPRKVVATQPPEPRAVAALHALVRAPVAPEPPEQLAADDPRTLRGALAAPLPEPLRARYEPLLGIDLRGVRMHADHEADRRARSHGAAAFTYLDEIHLSERALSARSADRVLAHELAHVAQQTIHRATSARADGAGAVDHEREADEVAAAMLVGRRPSAIHPVAPGIQRQERVDAEVYGPLSSFPSSEGGPPHRRGESSGTSVLTSIESGPDGITFRWFNFMRGELQTGSVQDWEFRRAVAVTFSASDTREFADLGRQMSEADWRRFETDPTTELLRRFEASRIRISDDAFLTMYRGSIFAEAMGALSSNEAQIDALLETPDRVRRMTEYARTLREASQVRDVMETRREELRQSCFAAMLAADESYGRYEAYTPYSYDPVVLARREQRRQAVVAAGAALDPVEAACSLWMESFPLLSRFRTAEITPERLEAKLREIKSDIVSTRAGLESSLRGRGSFDLWELDAVRPRVDARLGPLARGRVEAEQASRDRWSWFHLGASIVGTTALLFLPGGEFLVLVIGAGLATGAWERARDIGVAANTGLEADEGLMSRAAAASAETSAVIATVLAMLPVGLRGIRALTGGRMMLHVRAVAGELPVLTQMRLARLLAAQSELLTGVRSASELDAYLLARGVRLGAEELQAVGNAIARAQSVSAESGSLSSLRSFLRRIWNARERMGRQGDVYREYRTAVEANPLTGSAQAYTDELQALRAGRTAPQPIQGNGAFYHFYRQGASPDSAAQRIYLNVRADDAPRVMGRLVREVVDNPTEFPGVTGAKIAGPGSVSGRPESIVLYAESEEAATRALARIRQIQLESSGESFMTSTPPMTQPVYRGVSVAAEPPWPSPDVPISFGESRANIIFDALRESVAASEQEAQFIERVLRAMRAAGFDPAAPHANLPPP